MGKTILISSHILPELADMCTKVGIIEKGRLVASGSVDEVIARAQSDRWVQFEVATHAQGEAAVEAARKVAAATPGVLAVEDDPEKAGRLRARLDQGADPSAIPTAIIASGLRLVFYREEQIDLEDAFMRLTQGIVS